MLSYYIARIDGESSRSLFEQIYISHRYAMMYTANCILHDQMLAEDATHDAFLRIINHLEKITDPTSVKTRNFVVLMVKNIALDYYRKAKRQCESSYDMKEDAQLDTHDNPEECYLQNEAIVVLVRKISNLHPKYNLVLNMKYSLSYSNSEIAKILCISNDQVRLLLHRARKQLKTRCSREDEMSPEYKISKEET